MNYATGKAYRSVWELKRGLRRALKRIKDGENVMSRFNILSPSDAKGHLLQRAVNKNGILVEEFVAKVGTKRGNHRKFRDDLKLHDTMRRVLNTTNQFGLEQHDNKPVMGPNRRRALNTAIDGIHAR